MADTHVIIAGNLVEVPELKLTGQGTPVASLRVATTTRVRDGDTWKDGETSYHRITAWRDLAEHATESLQKGVRVIVVGRLKTRSWETDTGERRTVTEIEADDIAPSLKWAVAEVAKPDTAKTKAEAAAAFGSTEPPF